MRQSNLAIDLTESGYVPDLFLRKGMRQLIKQRLKEISDADIQEAAEKQSHFIHHMKRSPIAPLPEKANEQHYELPAAFFERVLGKYGKYSCGYWDEQTSCLDEAEEKSLHITCERAELVDGQQILELGCGWGSLTLFMAQRFPKSTITAVSNSHSQRQHIMQKARNHGLENLKIITCDMNDFKTDEKFDRIISVEMMEHMRNYHALYYRIASWLKDDGKFFKHIFVHRTSPYAFEVIDDSDWMSQYFFSGGMMPSDDLPLWFQEHLTLEQRWRWDGRHYEKTANAWLMNMDRQRDMLQVILSQCYGEEQMEIWWNRWRMFFMACAELFGYENGQQWFVSHYLFHKHGGGQK